MKATKLTFRARGLYLGPSELTAPDGGMTQADNVVVSRDGIVETRRGEDVVSTKALTRLAAWKDALIGHGGSTLSRSTTSGIAWSDYTGAIAPQSGEALRACESVGNLLLSDAAGVKRLDSLTGTPESAGVPAGLDVALELISTGSPAAMPTASMLAYRVVFGKKDANGRLIIGEPSGRAVIANASGATRDIGITGSVPQGLDSSHFYQIYRSTPSASATTDPGDQLGLVYEAPAPARSTGSSLSRSSNVVTATTTAAHNYAVGSLVQISPGGSPPGHVFAMGANTAAVRSTDSGQTWSAAGISGLPAGTFYGRATSGAVDVVVGASVAATSADAGLTWVSRTIPAGTYRAVAYGGGIFIAVGDGGISAVSTDAGATWSAGGPAGGWNLSAITYTGSTFYAIETRGSGWVPYWTANGGSWSTAGAGVTDTNTTAYGIATSGSAWLVVGSYHGTPAAWKANSASGPWYLVPLAGSGDVKAACWTGTVFVAVGNTGSAYWSFPASSGLNSVALAGSYNDVAWDGSAVVAVGTSVAATATANGQTWTPRTIAAGTYNLSLAASAASFTATEATVTSVPTPTTFTYAQTGADGTLTQAQTIQPLTFYYKDATPDGFLGASLYTNPNQDGILNANARPLLCKDLAAFRNSVFYANVTIPAFGTIDYLGGAANDDTVTVNGVVFTAKASESVRDKQFKLWTAGSVAENIRDTAASLVRCINRTLSPGATASIVSETDDIPGRILVTASSSTATLSVTVSRAASWSPSSGLSLSPTPAINGLVWSKTDQPDHVQKSLWLVPLRIGATDKAILRVVATRSSLFIFKQDGLWKLTGDAGVWDVQPFDPTVRLAAPESCAVVNNSIFCLTDAGVVRVSDTGVALISRQPDRCDIEPVIQAALTPTMRPVTKAYAFGVGYDSDHKYILWLPEASTDTQATNAYVYDLYTSAWTRRTDNASHGIVNPYDDRLYTVDGSSCWRERKSHDYTDLAGRSYEVFVTYCNMPPTTSTLITLTSAANANVGDVFVAGSNWAVITAKNGNVITLGRAIPVVPSYPATVHSKLSTAVTWAPSLGASPAYLSEFQEVTLHFDSITFVTASVGFATNFYRTPEVVTLTGSDYAFAQTPMSPFAVRVWPPRNTGMGSYLYVTWTHAQAWSPNSVSALTVQFASTSAEVSR